MKCCCLCCRFFLCHTQCIIVWNTVACIKQPHLGSGFYLRFIHASIYISMNMQLITRGDMPVLILRQHLNSNQLNHQFWLELHEKKRKGKSWMEKKRLEKRIHMEIKVLVKSFYILFELHKIFCWFINANSAFDRVRST